MKKDEHALSVQIVDKQFTLKCPPEKRDDLRACAQYVDSLMRSAMQGKAYIPGAIERTALMTAINIAYELRIQHNHLDTLQSKIEHILLRTSE
ncbi:MAG: cell division protein ZapA [Gammaproteobacteria bacterium]